VAFTVPGKPIMAWRSFGDIFLFAYSGMISISLDVSLRKRLFLLVALGKNDCQASDPFLPTTCWSRSRSVDIKAKQFSGRTREFLILVNRSNIC